MAYAGGRDRYRREYNQFPMVRSRSPEEKKRLAPSRHLWVGNLSHGTSENNLSNHFARFGNLESVAFQPGRSYAFINFKREEDAIVALNSLQGFSLSGLPLRIEFAKPEKSPIPSSRIEEYSRREEPRYERGVSKARHDHDMDEKNEEPSEILWVGFPVSLKVDDTILRKYFSPFGEIEKISAFPGRSYAFIQFKKLISACRAKEALQGRLFDNPRVRICYAKRENTGRGGGGLLINDHHHHRGHGFSDDIFDQDEDREEYGSLRSSHLYKSPPMDSTVWEAGNKRRFPSNNMGEDIMYDHRHHEHGIDNSGMIQRSKNVYFRDFSPEKRRNRQSSVMFDDPWDLPEDTMGLFNGGAKKLKTTGDGENELPEYPYSSGSQKEKHMMPSFSDSAGSPFDRTVDNNRSIMKKISCNPLEWKWEGTIAKGGTPVCRARCLPVGKVMDFLLPQVLDCTARTSLDMLAKHYYEASSNGNGNGAWVVFFVPGSDGDICYYNEFMNFLGEKQRAAVAKLDDRNTLFLVPPSQFSEKVLKVPGKLSISGVVLRLEPPQQPPLPSPMNYLEKLGVNEKMHDFSTLSSSRGYDNPNPDPLSSSSSLFMDYETQKRRGDYEPPHYFSRRNEDVHEQQPTTSSSLVMNHNYNYNLGNYADSFPIAPLLKQESKASSSSSAVPISNLQSEQLAQLASSLLGRHTSIGKTMNSDYQHQTERPSFVLPSSQYGGGGDGGDYGGRGQVENQNIQHQKGQEDELEADPQKRLQATLQLAAALLQQIQQGKSS